jgi:glucose-6-phosphate dehydrogenase assembly protein OpcA
VILDLGPGHLEHLDTIIDPLVITDLTTLVWAPHGHWEAVDALRRALAMRAAGLGRGPRRRRRAAARPGLLAHRYVVDLAWLRSTPWRERIAALFDQPPPSPARARSPRRDPQRTPSPEPRRCCLRLAHLAPRLAGGDS